MSRLIALAAGFVLGFVFAPDKNQLPAELYLPASCLDSTLILPGKAMPWLLPYDGEPPESGEEWL